MQCVEANALSLNDPVKKWLPNANIPDDVTVEDLAHHRSGLTTDSTPRRLCFARDRKFRYSNENYNLLTLIIEAATGIPYGQWLTEQVFDPLNLRHSFIVGRGRDAEIAQGHIGMFGHFVPGEPTVYGSKSWIQADSGATCSSAADAGRILRMLLGEGELDGVRILSPNSVQTILTNTVPSDGSPAVAGPLGSEGDYGLGWIHKKWNNEDIFVHVGKVPTHTTVFVLIPEPGIGIALMVNAGDFLVATPMIEDLADGVIRQVLGEPVGPPESDARAFRQAMLDLGYLGIIVLGLAGWLVRTENSGKAGLFAYHVLLPFALVFGIRHVSSTPFPWLWRFAPDASAAVGFSAINMVASGVWKALSLDPPMGRVASGTWRGDGNADEGNAPGCAD